MFNTIIRILKEQKIILITVIVSFSIIGAVIGFFKKGKVRVVEIDPTTLYREEVLSKIKSEEIIKPENLKDVIEEKNVISEWKENKENNLLDSDKEKEEEKLKVEKTLMNQLLEK